MKRIGSRLAEMLASLSSPSGDEVCSVDRIRQTDINIRLLTDLAPTVIWTRAADNTLTYLNDYWYDYTGCDKSRPLTEVTWSEYIHPDDIPALSKAYAEGRAGGGDYSAECRVRRADGQYRWFKADCRAIYDDVSNEPIQWLGSGVNIDDLKAAKAELLETKANLERLVEERTAELQKTNVQLLEEIAKRQDAMEALRQSQKMEAVGQLTGGIAHDFNNMLTVIIGNLELIKLTSGNLGEVPAAARITRNITSALEASLKAEKLTAQLLAFSRKTKLRPERLNVNEIIMDVQDMVQRAVGKNNLLKVDLVSDIWLCLSDKTQLESAIINLAINARDAQPGGGEIIIRTFNRTIGDQRFVSVQVCDHGEGISPENIEKVIEPFFTTKDVGKGSGLGLSMVYGFCQQSNGKLEITSDLGTGTCVDMLFPFVGGVVNVDDHVEHEVSYKGDRKTILVVDDESGVRELACSLLAEMGYNALSANNGEHAVRILADASIRIDLVFTDIVMPNGIDGFQVGREANRLRPGVPVIFTTGHAEIALKELREDEAKKLKLLGKPYRMGELSQILETTLTKSA